MAETRTALSEIAGRIDTLDRQINGARESAETYYGLGDNQMKDIAAMSALRNDYAGLLAKLEA